ncbi:MAG TPA: undecaprenyl-phosphate glucose phosphotransferase [Microvirga sp.]|nr:undecaprenyl-phosphate glucose phosphotransferase [Microvirga sp.]
MSQIDTETASTILQPSAKWRALPLSYESIGPFILTIDFILITAFGVFSGVTYHLAMSGSAGNLASFLGAGYAIAAVFVLVLQALGAYRPSLLTGPRFRLGNLLFIWVCVFAFMATVAFFLKVGDQFSRGTMVLFLLTGFAGVAANRLVIGRMLGRALSSGALRGHNVVVVGDLDNAATGDLARSLETHGFRVLRSFLVSAGSAGHAGRADADAKAIAEVIAFVRSNEVDEIFVAMSWAGLPRIDEITSQLHVLPLPVRLIANCQLRSLLEKPLSEIGPMPAVKLQRAPLSVAERCLKRGFDVVVAGAALLLLAPLFLMVAVAIRIDSEGPVFFRQRRIGFSGRTFRIFKFRTMTALEDGPVVRQATRDDQRITRVGRWLRRTSIDELPQLLNVIRGEMSLVGPRPHANAHDSEFDRLIANYALRHHVKPGITGWAQVHGLRGETPTVDLIRRRVEYDLSYIERWSFLLDARILVLTVKELLKGSNAY